MNVLSDNRIYIPKNNIWDLFVTTDGIILKAQQLLERSHRLQFKNTQSTCKVDNVRIRWALTLVVALALDVTLDVTLLHGPTRHGVMTRYYAIITRNNGPLLYCNRVMTRHDESQNLTMSGQPSTARRHFVKRCLVQPPRWHFPRRPPSSCGVGGNIDSSKI